MNKAFDSGPDVCGPVGCAVGDTGDGDTGDKVELSKAEWESRLDGEQYRVLRQQGTERAFTSPLYLEKREGTYTCAGCGAALFDSSKKYESGTGWPSFFEALEGSVETAEDNKHGMVRTEYHCARCGGHHGHIFPDGPRPTGLRYCNNGISLKFVPRSES